MIQDIN